MYLVDIIPCKICLKNMKKLGSITVNKWKILNSLSATLSKEDEVLKMAVDFG